MTKLHKLINEYVELRVAFVLRDKNISDEKLAKIEIDLTRARMALELEIYNVTGVLHMLG